MAKRNIILTLIAITTCMASCRSPRLVSSDENNLLPKSNYKQDSIYLNTDPWLRNIWTLDHDTTLAVPGSPFVLEWDYKLKSIKNTPSIVNIGKVLVDSAYVGNKQSENILILKAITENKKRGVIINCRGKRIFDINMEPLGDFTLRKTDPQYGETMFSYYLQNVYPMIKSIDNKSPDEYAIDFMIMNEKITHFDATELMIRDKTRFDKLYYKALLYAWENDLIVLKDYGEK